MTDQPVTGRPMAAPAPRAQTLKAQNLVNRIVRGLLRTPLLRQLAGRRLVTVYVTGRKSGRRYAVPVAYTRHEGDLPHRQSLRLGPQPPHGRGGDDPAQGPPAARRRPGPG